MSGRDVSPAAAAAISRLLTGAGLRRAVEYRKGIEVEGYYAEPRGDRVRVDYTPGFLVAPDEALAVVEPGLARCKEALVAAGYEVTQVTDEGYVYGGNPPMSMPVLEVRKPGWTER